MLKDKDSGFLNKCISENPWKPYSKNFEREGKLYYIYLDFFLVFLVQNDKIWSEMNKKDNIEARKAIFDMHKVFIICTFVYTNMVINYVNFKIFMSKYRN